MRKMTDIETPYLKQRAPFSVGDTVDVGVVITETIEKKGKLEEKERIQIFQGVVIARSGTGVAQSFTVRRIVAGEGVERVFPVHSPKVASIKVLGSKYVRRAKLYYLRDRKGKSARLRDKIGVRETEVATPAAAEAPQAAK